jgi:hypothetical protein
MRNRKATQLNCFSPPVMVATVIIELSLAIYTIWRYKMNTIGRLVAVTLVMLAGFQVSEYFVCTGSAGHVPVWSRLGFAIITVLPPLGLHLLHVVADKPKRRLVALAYLSMAGFIATFLLIPHAFNNYQCNGNYVIFHLRANLGGLYWYYYFGWLGISIGFGMRWANQLMSKGKSAIRQLQAVRGLIIGWLVFVLPTAIINVARPSTRDGLPSIMCGFAVFFALILGFYILPRVADRKAAIPSNRVHK